jgi:hypothetical protein
MDLAAGCLILYTLRLSKTKLFILSIFSKLVLEDSSIKSKEKKKVSKYMLAKFKQSFKVVYLLNYIFVVLIQIYV